jgi:hypothetical protein
MPIDDRQGSKVAKNIRKEDAPGTRVDPYPYLGIVKNNIDPIRAGRLQVWIADFGGDPNEPKNWRTVSYCSPFMGSTNIPVDGSKTNSWEESPQTYGMWMTPPDIGVEVLCIFLSGDSQKGYWFGCVNSKISRYMFPGNACTQYPSTENSSSEVKSTYAAAKQDYGDIVAAPVTEFNSNFQDYATDPNFVNIPRPIHEPQYNILTTQGLDRDKYRGVISSSSQRETPSAVYGISTPGRAVKDPALDPTFEDKVKAGTLTEADRAVKTRKGGHTFIMDDGDLKDDNRLVRLRSSSGHQIIMNDSANTLYISNNIGTVWMEFTAEGRLQIYSSNGMDVRTQGNMNFHIDQILNINAGGKINIKSEDDINVECNNLSIGLNGNFLCGATGKYEINAAGGVHAQSNAKISLTATGDIVLQGASIKQNSGGGVAVTPPKQLTANKLPDTSFDSGKKLWIQKPNIITTIVEKAPCHEPSPRPNASREPVPPAPPSPAPSVIPQSTGTKDIQVGIGSSSGTTGASTANSSTGTGTGTSGSGTPVSAPITTKDIRNQPMSNTSVGNISKEGTTSLFAQIAKNASDVVSNTASFVTGVGKYLADIPSLISAGLVKSSVTDMSQLNIGSNWIQSACSSLTEFQNNSSLQENVMSSNTLKNYNLLCLNGVINDTNISNTSDVAGWLSVAHTMGVDGAINYSKGVNTALGDSLFQQGRYAMSLESQVLEIMAG